MIASLFARIRNRRAYLIAHIDTSKKPPCVTSVGIYSELSPSNDRHFLNVEVFRQKADTYGQAVRKVLEMIVELHQVYEWVIPFLSERYGENLEELKLEAKEDT
jgi:hypothetical protein